jgi:hypothetical protein
MYRALVVVFLFAILIAFPSTARVQSPQRILLLRQTGSYRRRRLGGKPSREG